MPVEPSDNTRVVRPLRPEPILIDPELVERLRQYRIQLAMQLNQALLWDADKVKRYENMLNFYNNNFWGYGVSGHQTNYNPRTPQGLAAIQSNFDYAKSNVLNFAETLLTTGMSEGIGQAVRWATTPTTIGAGAEAIVSSTPVSTTVTKVTTIPRAEMHIRNTVPGALKSRYVRTANGLHTYVLPKIRILNKEQLARAGKALEKTMIKKGWRKITHPNLDGVGYTNGNWVVSDLGQGNIGRDWLGRVRLADFSVESIPAFRMAIRKQGGRLINNN